MSGWTGFTDAELRKMRTDGDLDPLPQTMERQRPVDETTKPVKVSKVGQQQQQKKKANFPRWDAPPQKEKEPQTNNQNIKKIPEPTVSSPAGDGKSSVNPCTKADVSSSNASTKVEPSTKAESSTKVELSTTVEPSTKVEPSDNIEAGDTNATKEVEIGILTESEQQKLLLTNLEQLQQKQKLIEDENKKKQTLIQQTLQERFKQTQTESQKLKEIHRQLKRVDAEFQTDVEDLRDRIDEACVLFSHAEKRHEKAEKEYVAAKLDYFHKKDVKDELTEQLYAIIQENEIKKAKKLEELMAILSNDVVSPNAAAAPSSPESTTQLSEVTSTTQPSSPESTTQLSEVTSTTQVSEVTSVGSNNEVADNEA